MKLEKIQKEYSQYEEKIKEKNEHSNLQKAQITSSQNLMNLSLTEYQNKFCRKYTEADHQAMLIQQEEICEKLKSHILANNIEITKYFQKLCELNIASQEYNYLLVLSNYAQEILQLRREIAQLKPRISELNTDIAYKQCYANEYANEYGYGVDDQNENNFNELNYLEEKLDRSRNKLVEMELRFLEENLSVFVHCSWISGVLANSCFKETKAPNKLLVGRCRSQDLILQTL